MVTGVRGTGTQAPGSGDVNSSESVDATAAQALRASTSSDASAEAAAAGPSLRATQDSVASAAETLNQLDISRELVQGRKLQELYDHSIIERLRPEGGKIDKSVRKEIAQKTLDVLNEIRKNPLVFRAVLIERYEGKVRDNPRLKARTETSFNKSMKMLEKFANRQNPQIFKKITDKQQRVEFRKALKEHTNDYADGIVSAHDSFSSRSEIVPGGYEENVTAGDDLNIFTALESWIDVEHGNSGITLKALKESYGSSGGDFKKHFTESGETIKDNRTGDVYNVLKNGIIQDENGFNQDSNDLKKGHLETMFTSTPKSAAVDVSVNKERCVAFMLGVNNF